MSAVLLVAYIGLAHALLVVPESDVDEVLNRRDAEYFGLLGGTLAGSVLVGIGIGAMLRRSPFAFALLMLALVFIGLVGIQVGTFELACDGQNDIVRHWRCTG